MRTAASLLVSGLFALGAAPVEASMESVKKARCVACHAVDAKRVGPAFRDIASRYAGQADAQAKLFEKVRNGGAGAWGEVPMLAQPEDRIGDEELNSAIAWILGGAPN